MNRRRVLEPVQARCSIASARRSVVRAARRSPRATPRPLARPPLRRSSPWATVSRIPSPLVISAATAAQVASALPAAPHSTPASSLAAFPDARSSAFAVPSEGATTTGHGASRTTWCRRRCSERRRSAAPARAPTTTNAVSTVAAAATSSGPGAPRATTGVAARSSMSRVRRHQEAGELLIRERPDLPYCRTEGVRRIPRGSCERHQRASAAPEVNRTRLSLAPLMRRRPPRTPHAAILRSPRVSSPAAQRPSHLSYRQVVDLVAAPPRALPPMRYGIRRTREPRLREQVCGRHLSQSSDPRRHSYTKATPSRKKKKPMAASACIP